MKKARIGLIGVGGVCRGVHIEQLTSIKEAEIVAICDIDDTALVEVGDMLNIPKERRYKDYKDLLACDDIDGVEICTSNDMHCIIAAEAVKQNIPFNLEKPIDVDYKSAKILEEALKKNPVKNMMCFSYRFFPAVRYAKKIMEDNLLGNIINVDIKYNKDSAFWEGRPFSWRFSKEKAGTGVLGDLGVHLADLATFLLGDDIVSVCGKIATIVKERPCPDTGKMLPVETDDISMFMAETKNGTPIMFNISRCAYGYDNDICFRIYGDKGTIAFDANNPDELEVCVGEIDIRTKGRHTIKVPGNYALKQEQNFVDMILGKDNKYHPTAEDGFKIQKVLDAVLESSIKKCWINIE